MFEEKISIIPGFSASRKPPSDPGAHKPRKRFAKVGPNAEHEHTLRMRQIKASLRLTTAQVVNELNAYEREHQAKNFRKRTDPSVPAWLPMTTVLMSSYLQGWVVQDSYMALMLKRLENLYKFKKGQGEVAPRTDIRTIMDGWYAALEIDPADSSVSPTRQLGRLIAPYYKRPVLAGISGTFHLGFAHDALQTFSITDADGVTHDFTLNPKEEVLVEDGKQIKVGDVIQYSVLMQTQKIGDKTIVTHEPSINHTTFFRWYSNNKMPRSIKTIELVQAAVDEAMKAMKKSKKTR